MGVYQVKAFQSQYLGLLRDRLNKWLVNVNCIYVHKVEYSTAVVRSIIHYSVIVFYSVPQDEVTDNA